jgi:hypothetical protein
MYTETKYSRRKATCEFCKASHGTADTCDMKVGQVSANSEEGCRELTLKDVLKTMEHFRELVVGIIFKENTGSLTTLTSRTSRRRKKG